MKVGILCGAARMAHRKAFVYYNAILEAGHTPVIFSRAPLQFNAPHTVAPTIPEMILKADQSGADFFMACTDALGDAVSTLNQSRGRPYIPQGAARKDNLGALTPKMLPIKTWGSLDEVPDDLPIFIKPSNGSGKSGGDPWAYEHYESVAAFKKFLDTVGGLHRFQYAQDNPGLMGKYVIQEYIFHDHQLYCHFLNDGVAQPYLKCHIPFDYGEKRDRYSTYSLYTQDDYDFLPNVVEGVLCAFQAIPADIPRIMDFNVRCGGQWTAVYEHACPNFYVNYFNNLLNGKQEKYNWQCSSYTLVPEPKDGLIITIDDYPFNNQSSKQGLVLND